MDNNEKRGIRKEYLVMIIIAVAVVVSAVLIGSYTNSKSNEIDSFNSSSSSYSSTYKDIYTALEDRSIYYGMTYEEIKKYVALQIMYLERMGKYSMHIMAHMIMCSYVFRKVV